jgi:excisionase family DNA binding protein
MKALSIQAIAERWGVSEETVRKEIQAGTLKAFRIGRRQWRVLEDDFAEYIAGRSNRGAAA